jgi:hypothetical protein
MRGKVSQRKVGRLAAFATAVLLVLTGAAFDASAKPPIGSTPVAQGPILDPRTGSYFELRVDNSTASGSGHSNAEWSAAYQRAQARNYNGRQGRLAVVADAATLNFIREQFRINEEVWIGLRFFCKFRKLLWVTGDMHPLHEKSLWARQWFRNQAVRCSTQRIDFMPVYLTKEDEGVAWQASGPAKYFVSYLVEYPATKAIEQPKPDADRENEAAPPAPAESRP